ncbi:hypothetical protein AB0D08_33650 [Kitasatospora sp. NPDC048540]|uniref:hypothetical protein n=1 Tax=unclassified Kitasatospora TaxID=2633591 RepID=UPI000539E605|nr:hypothetical protein [Kitasatospora sp. MBT63]
MTAFDAGFLVAVNAFLLANYVAVRMWPSGLRATVAYLLLLNVAVLWLVHDVGSGWGLPVTAAVSLVAAVLALRSSVREMTARIAVIDGPGFDRLITAVAAAEGPQVLGLCVVPTGALMVIAMPDAQHPEGRRFVLPPGADCHFCRVEEKLRLLLGDGSVLVTEYRGHLRAGRSRHALVRRASAAEPWTGRLRDRVLYRAPAPGRRPPCAVHDAIVGAG